MNNSSNYYDAALLSEIAYCNFKEITLSSSDKEIKEALLEKPSAITKTQASYFLANWQRLTTTGMYQAAVLELQTEETNTLFDLSRRSRCRWCKWFQHYFLGRFFSGSHKCLALSDNRPHFSQE